MKNTTLYSETIALRIDESNPNHHLWNNNGTWWIHYTICPTPVTAERVRSSLKTKCLSKARRYRDEILYKLLHETSSIAA